MAKATSTITAEQAQRELARRLATKAQKATGRKAAISAGTFSVPTAQLREIAGVQKASKTKTTTERKAEVSGEEREVKIAAKAAFDAAFAAAEGGTKMRAGKTAFGRIMRGESLDDVLASITA